MAEKLSVWYPLRLAPSDAAALDEAAKMRNLKRSEVLRSLIRSLNKPAIEKAAS